MASKFCVDCADCQPANPHQQPTSNKFRCRSPLAVGVHYTPMGESPRPFGTDTDQAPSCNEMRNDSPVFQTCGPDAKWFRTAKQKADGDAQRHNVDAVKAQARQDDLDRKAAAAAPAAE